MLIWEYCLLDSTSKMRMLLSDIFSNSSYNPIDLLPNLRVDILESFFGKEDFLDIQPLKDDTIVPFDKIGAAIALWSWLGINDLHAENVKFGLHNGTLVFTPIDIESLFFENKTLHDTLLTSKKSDIRFPDGLSLIEHSIKRTEDLYKMLIGFAKTIRLLNLHQSRFLEIFNDLKQQGHYQRVILRSTKDYAQHLNGTKFIQDLVAEENVQITRKDVPYFFKKMATSDILYFEMGNSISKLQSNVGFLYFLNEIENPSDLIFLEGKMKIFLAQILEYFFRYKPELLKGTIDTDPLYLVEDQQTIVANIADENLVFKVKYGKN